MNKLLSIVYFLFFALPSFAQLDTLAYLKWKEEFIKYKENLENSKGFGPFIYGTTIKQYKNIELVPDFNNRNNSLHYISKVPFIYEDIKIDSSELFFYKKKLTGMSLYLNKPQYQKAIAYLEKLYGPKSALLSEEGSSVWEGNSVSLSVSAIHNNRYMILFVRNNEDENIVDEIDESLLKE